jgi:hypothetical protein
MAKEFKYLKRERRPYMAPSRSVYLAVGYWETGFSRLSLMDHVFLFRKRNSS